MSDISSYNLSLLPGVDKPTMFNVFNEMHKRSLMLSLPLISGAKEAILHTTELGNTVDFITSRDTNYHPNIYRQTLEYLRNNGMRHFPVHFSKDKGKICDELGLDVMIEDNPAYFQGIVDSGTKLIVFSKPWNVMYSGKRMRSWNELETILEQK
jgi:hypothetical protein